VSKRGIELVAFKWFGQRKAHDKPMRIRKCSAGSTETSCSAQYAQQHHKRGEALLPVNDLVGINPKG
jgi:hypothetical protein